MWTSAGYGGRRWGSGACRESTRWSGATRTGGGWPYTMRAARQRDQLALLLAEDPQAVRQVLAKLRPDKLEHHPAGWLAQNALDPAWASTSAESSEAAMVCLLQEGALDAYWAAVEKGRPPGHVNWPLPFLAH